MRVYSAVFVLTMSLACTHTRYSVSSSDQAVSQPKLVVTVVFDQLRADYLGRFGDQLLPAVRPDGSHGGFRALMARGAYFPVAEHNVLMSMTGPGHATIATGSWPYRHGIARNRWYENGRKAYCVEDVNAAVTGADSSDPFRGRSPRNLRGPTFGDTLKGHDPRSKSVSVAIKDRAAILMGGHRPDGVYWVGFDGTWTSSRYYLGNNKRPDWLAQINAGRAKRASQDYHYDYESTSGRSDQGPNAVSFKVKTGDYKAIASPYADEYTLEAVRGAIKAHELGQDEVPDTLWVSFSGFDKVGHHTGPNSAKMEAMFLTADRSLSRLLNHLERTVPGGLDRVLISVTGDHGVGPQVEYAQKKGLPSIRQDHRQIRARIEARLASLFGKPGAGQTWLDGIEDLNLYINRRLAAVRAIPLRRLEAAAAELLTEEPGVLLATTRHQVLAGILPPGRWGQQLKNQFVPGRSGDVIGIPAPFVLPDKTPANHYTGYAYDRQVPLLISGPGIRQGRYHQVVNIIDLMPTLSAAIGTIHPALAEGRVLHEILNQRAE